MDTELSDYYVVWDGVGVRNPDGSPAFVVPHVASSQERQFAAIVSEAPPRGTRRRPSRAKDRAEWKRRMISYDLRGLLEQESGWLTVREVVDRSGYSYNQARNALYMVAKAGLIRMAYRPVERQRPICIYAKLGTPPER